MRLPKFRDRYFGLAVFFTIVISIVLMIMCRYRAYDDPYITYRYADNIRRGLGFVYNPGEHVQSTTTPLFTLLLAVLSMLWGDLPQLANLIGALSLALGGLLLWDLASTWKTPWAGWAGLFLYPIFPLAITPLGSETPLYIALCLGAFAAYARRHYKLTAVCAALATLTRPDGLLVGMILAGDFAIRRYLKKRYKHLAADDSLPFSIPWKAVIIFLSMLLPWFLFAWGYFGLPLPVTLAAKQQQGALAVSQRFAQGFLTTLGWYKTWRYELEAGLALLGVVFIVRRTRRWLLYLAWPILHFIAYSILGVSRYFWYYTPLVPGFLIAAGLGLQAIADSPQDIPKRLKEHLPNWMSWRWMARIRPAQILSLVILAVLCLGQIRSLPRLRQPDARYTIYRAAGEWLAGHTPVDSTIGALEVGIIGYYARRPMVDFAGLIRPEVAAQLTGGTGYEYAASWTVDHFQLQYLVLFQGDFPQLEQDDVSRRCLLEQIFPGKIFNYEKDLAIYDCR